MATGLARVACAAIAGIALVTVLSGCARSGLDPVALPVSSSTTTAAAPRPPDLAEKGDCLRDNGSDYTEVPCSSLLATHVVLDRLPGSDADCRPVPGVYYTYLDSTGRGTAKVCVGFKDRDPANGINVARVGDCVLMGEGIKGQRVPCTTPGASRVLNRFEKAAVSMQTCNAVPGTTRVGGWRLKMLGAGLNVELPGPKRFDVVFCLAPA